MASQILPYFADKRVLVTGASGYIATNLINSLKDIDCTIVRLSRGDSLVPVHSKANIVDVTGDIGTKKTFEELLGDVDIIFYLSAQTGVYVANENPVADLADNVVPMLYPYL